MIRRDYGLFGLVGTLIAFVTVYLWTSGPTYTDAYYYINAANRLVQGDGMTDAYLWMYVNAPDTLPAPSHLYWMPMASWLAALGMWALRAPMSYWAAQIPFALMLSAMGMSAFWLVDRWGGVRRQAWVAGLIVLMGGFFSRFWGVAETFTPFGFFGVGTLIALGIAGQRGDWRAALFAGVCTTGAHLSRADGLLFLLAGWAAWFWLWDNELSWPQRVRLSIVLLLAYLVTMSPWFARSMAAFGAPLPIGGTRGIWFTEYNDIFSYPQDATMARFFEVGGWPLFWQSRWTGISTALGTLLAVEGLIVMAPLMLLALFRRWRDPFLRPMWIYALGLHVAMSVVFPFAGYRGGLFHSVAALFPFWAALGVIGLDDAVLWVARRRHWNPRTAVPFFTGVLLVVAIALSVFAGIGGRISMQNDALLYESLRDVVPPDARVMVNDPAEMYYRTGLGGVVLPNEPVDVLPIIATQYEIDYLLIEQAPTLDGEAIVWAVTDPLLPLIDVPPVFLVPVPFDYPTARLYRFELDTLP